MDYQQKCEALQALGDVKICMRKPGNWYVQHSVEVKNGSFLTSKYGNGGTPEEAIEDHWRALTDLASDEYLVIQAYGEDRKAFRWNGYRWAELAESA